MKNLDKFIILSLSTMLLCLFRKLKGSRRGLESVEMDSSNYSLRDKKVATSGDFFPTSRKGLKRRLGQLGAQVQPELDKETQILICGKYPDYRLIEEARNNGIKVIFIDKVSDLSSRPKREPAEEVAKPIGRSSVPLGV